MVAILMEGGSTFLGMEVVTPIMVDLRISWLEDLTEHLGDHGGMGRHIGSAVVGLSIPNGSIFVPTYIYS